MNISNDYAVMIFASEFNGKRYYKAGLSKKDVNGEYINGYKDVWFKNDVFVHNQTKINIKKAWLDFYVKDKKTIDYIFISEFEIVEDKKEELEEINEMQDLDDPYFLT